MDDAASESRNTHKSLTGLILFLLFFLVVALIFSHDMDGIKRLILSAGWFGVILSVLLYALMGATVIPSEPFTLLVTSLFGPLVALLVASVGNLLAALVEFLIGGKVSEVANFEEKKEKLPFGLGKLKVDSPLFLILARMLPGYGPKFVSVIAGMYKVPFWRYCWTTAVSTLIGAAAVAYASFGLINIPWIKGILN